MIVTRDETCTKVSQSTLTKKFKTLQSTGKIMASACWEEDILLINYRDKGVIITVQYYADLPKQLKKL